MTTFSAAVMYDDGLVARLHIAGFVAPTTIVTGMGQYVFLTPKPPATGQLWPRPRIV